MCGQTKAACIDVRFNVSGAKPTLASIRTAGEAHYPLFFCKDKTPDAEPSCLPSRSVSTKGSSVYTGEPAPGDADGDGIPDGQDNCPKIFNPIRPMDNGRQADADNDGMSDAWERANGSNPNGNDAMTKAADGYALIEHYVNWLAGPHASTTVGGSVDIDLAAYATGFSTVSPTFSLSVPTVVMAGR